MVPKCQARHIWVSLIQHSQDNVSSWTRKNSGSFSVELCGRNVDKWEIQTYHCSAKGGYTQTCPQFGALTRTSGEHPDAKICCQLWGLFCQLGTVWWQQQDGRHVLHLLLGGQILTPIHSTHGLPLGIFFNALSTLEQNIVALLVELCLMDRLNQVTQSPTFHRSRRSQGRSRGSSICT